MIIVGIGNLITLLFHEFFKLFMGRIQGNTVKFNGRVCNCDACDIPLVAGIIGICSNRINHTMLRVNSHSVFVKRGNIAGTVKLPASEQTALFLIAGESRIVNPVPNPKLKRGIGTARFAVSKQKKTDNNENENKGRNDKCISFVFFIKLPPLKTVKYYALTRSIPFVYIATYYCFCSSMYRYPCELQAFIFRVPFIRIFSSIW